MTDGPLTTSDAEPAGEGHPFLAVRDELIGTPADELARQLPNLVASVVDASDAAATERLLIGVSFTRDRAPLDYELDRIVERNDRYQRETLKEPVSADHLYLHFAYPPDPQFTAIALRGALLGAIEREIHAASTAPGSDATAGGGSIVAALARRLGAPF